MVDREKINSVNDWTLLLNNVIFPLFVKKWPFHIIFWAGYLSLAYISSFNSILRLESNHMLINFVYVLILFYMLSFFFIPAIYCYRRHPGTALNMIILLAVLVFGKILLTRYFTLVEYDLYEFIMNEFTRLVHFGQLALGFWLLELLFRMDKTLDDKKMENTRLKIETDQYRLSPHFLFNTINSFMVDIYPISKEVANSFIKLADVLKYSMDTGPDANTLKAELRNVENLLSLQYRRFKNKLNLHFDNRTGEHMTENFFIPKMILITFIENIFKHGLCTDPDNPVVIKLYFTKDPLDASKIFLVFETKNKIAAGREPESLGMGLDKTRKLLGYYFPGRYSLVTDKKSDVFNLKLTIKYDREIN